MKKNLYLIVCSLILLYGCEEVIELDLDNAAPRIVIDGAINDQYERQTVRVSTTYKFTEPNRFNGLSGASVVMTSADGDVFNFTESQSNPGVYRSARLRGKQGMTYTLKVTVEGKTYTSVSEMPLSVSLDSLTFRQYTFFGEVKTYAAANYEDPGYIQNYYRYLLRIKGKTEKDVVGEDRFNNGKQVANVLYYALNDLNNGDTIHVEMQGINRQVYRYFYTLEQISGDGGPPVAPENPPSNFDNGALGVFNAYTSSKRMAIIKKP